jgi:hypothetical protein
MSEIPFDRHDIPRTSPPATPAGEYIGPLRVSRDMPEQPAVRKLSAGPLIPPPENRSGNPELPPHPPSTAEASQVAPPPERSPFVAAPPEAFNPADIYAAYDTVLQEPDFAGPAEVLGEGMMSRGIAYGRYVMRVPHATDPAERAAQVGDYVEALARGAGVEGLEQIRAASKAEGKVISVRLPGKRARDAAAADFAILSDNHYERALDVCEIMQQRGIHSTASDTNCTVDAVAGIGYLDYESSEAEDVQPLEDKIEYLIDVIGFAGGPNVMTALEPQVYEAAAQDTLQRIPVLTRLQGICKRRYASQPEILEHARSQINRVVAELKAQYNNYTDPQFVSLEIAEHQVTAALNANRDKPGNP